MVEKKTILIADDEFNTRTALERFFKRKYAISTAADGSEALALIGQQQFDLVLTDLRMPGADGMSVLEAASKKGIPCVLLTAYGSITDAVQAVKLGAYDFVSKPVKLNQLETVIEAALSQKVPEKVSVKVQLPPKKELSGIVAPDGIATPMLGVYETARTVAPSRASVLLSGESGTGKEVIARLIHENSGRSGAFIPVHCAALTSTILESELFGYEKGAFTGANERRSGKFELADKGTVFLDEIGEIDAATQVKLLRVLENRTFERIGGTETLTSDARIVAATNRDLAKMVSEGTFREDLYYRLNVVTVHLAGLRERKEDIPLLIKHFMDMVCRDNGRDLLKISPEAMKALERYDYPGNIRELRNSIERMVVLARGDTLELADVPEHILNFAPAAPEKAVVTEPAKLNLGGNERKLIEQALKSANGNRTHAAEILGISRRTLHRRLNEYAASGDPIDEN